MKTYTQTADMLEWAIDYLVGMGCTFGTLDQLTGSWYYS